MRDLWYKQTCPQIWRLAFFKVRKDDKFRSRILKYDGTHFTGYKIEPETSTIESMEVIALDKVITEVLEGRII